LLDACEITNFKCPKAVYDEIKDDLKNIDGTPDKDAIEFWEGHMNIRDIGFSKPNIEIIINNSRKTRKIVDRLIKEIESIQQIFRDNGIDVPVVQERARKAGVD